MSNIVGVSSCSGHDTGAAIIKDGKLVAAVEEERLNRQKHYHGFPKMSIDYCLNVAGLSRDDIEYVGLSWDPAAYVFKRLKFALITGDMANIYRRFRFVLDLSRAGFRVRSALKKMFPKAKIICIEHHLAHAASTFYASNFSDAAILTMDGRGEWATAMLAVGSQNDIKKIKELFYPASLGLFYAAFTHYLGFYNHDEYKVMGLAPYGSPKYLDFFRKALRFSENSIVRVDTSYVRHPGYTPVEWGENYYSEKVVAEFGPARKPGEPISQHHMDIAASLQARFNEIGVEIAAYLYSITKKENLCMAGGVALNGVMNWNIKSKGPFKNIFIQPASGDSGLAVGSALYIKNSILRDRQNINFEHAYWGPEYSNEEIGRELEMARIDYTFVKDPSAVGAYLLKEGYVIGWFQGRSEFGPRALGNRSILADPRKAENKDIVNARIKFREEFRPFAPSVLEEEADRYFCNCNGPAASYMLFVAPVMDGIEKVIPAVTHVDNTARVQTVSGKTNPLYHSLIKHFHRFTGVPVVLNTSFNVKGEPIVNSPSDAMKCFYTTGLDFLIMGNYLIYKKPILDSLKKAISNEDVKQ